MKKVQEKMHLERSASQRLAAGASQPPPPQARKPQPVIDLFGDDDSTSNSNTQPPAGAASAPPKAETAPPKPTNSALLGMDFLGGGSSQPSRPASTGPTSSAASRPDLKQSILSLYASTPKPAVQQQHARPQSFAGLASPPAQTSPQQSSFGGLNDAFSSLSFAAQPAPKPSPFSGLDSFSSAKSPPTTSSSNMFGGGGNFFDTKPKSPPVAQNRTMSASSGMADFSAFSSPAPSKPAASTSNMNDLLDLSMPAPSAPKPAPTAAFNLSPAAPAPAPASSNFSNLSGMDAWGSSSNDVWGSSAPSQPAAATTTNTVHAAPKSPGWGAPAVAQDDDFGGWSSAAPVQKSTAPGTGNKSGGFGGGSDDLFSNVWE